MEDNEIVAIAQVENNSYDESEKKEVNVHTIRSFNHKLSMPWTSHCNVQSLKALI